MLNANHQCLQFGLVIGSILSNLRKCSYHAVEDVLIRLFSARAWHVLLRRWSAILRTRLWILLVLSSAFFSVSEHSRQAAAQLNSSLLTISVIAVLLPGAFHMALQGSQGQDEGTLDQEILKTSHGVRN